MRGRPSGRMTPSRLRALEVLMDAAERGEHISLAKLARRIGVHSYNDARRIRADLQKLGAI